MKKLLKSFALVLCLALFAVMAMGSGSESSNEISSTGDSSSSGSSSKVEVSVEEQVILDQDGVIVTVTGYETDSIWGDSLKLLIENNSDIDLTIGCDALIVNDYMIYDLFSSEVAVGKKANENLYLSSSELKAAGIDTVGKVEVYLHAYNENYDTVFDGVYAEIQTSEYANMDTTPNDGGIELYNANGIRIVGKTVDQNSFWGAAVLLYLENTSDRNVSVSLDNMSINGFMLDGYFYSNIYAGKRAIDTIDVFSSDLEDNGIETFDEVEVQFNIYDSDTYNDIDKTGPITFSANS